MQLSNKPKGREPFCLSWDTVLFFAIYAVSPAYLGLDLGDTLPVLSLSRTVLILMAVMLFWRRRKDLSLKNMNLALTGEPILRWGILAFFALLLICDVASLPSAKSDAIKSIFNFLIEGYAIILLLTLLLDTREKLSAAIRILVIASGVISLLSIIGCIADVNLFHFLKTVQRKMLMSNYYRLGVLRASATFGHPVYYGTFCAVILPLNMYFYEQSRSIGEKVLLGACMNMTATGLILCNSRGSLVVVGFMVFVIFLHRTCNRQFKHFMLHYLPILGSLAVTLVALAFLLPNGDTLFGGIWQSLMNILPGQSQDPTQGTTASSGPASTPVDPGVSVPSAPTPPPTTAPPVTKPEYGENAGGMRSRFTQLTGLKWTLRHKPLFGFGANAHTRGLIQYEVRPGVWWKSKTFDMGIVAVFCQRGIVGLLGYACLYGSLLFTGIRKKYRRDPLMIALLFSLVSYLMCLLTISTLDCALWLLVAFIVCATNVIRSEGDQ